MNRVSHSEYTKVSKKRQTSGTAKISPLYRGEYAVWACMGGGFAQQSFRFVQKRMRRNVRQRDELAKFWPASLLETCNLHNLNSV